MIEVGMAAPEFELPCQTGEKIALSDLLRRYKAVVLAFYLLDFSGG